MAQESVDWTSLATWWGGLATVISSIGIAIFYAIRAAAKVATKITTTYQDTQVITFDSVALKKVSSAIDGLNSTMSELSSAIGKLHVAAEQIKDFGVQYTRDREAERSEVEMEAEVERRVKERLEAESKKTQKPARRVTTRVKSTD